MTSLQIHNCQFVDCIPDAITSIVPSPSQKYIAVGRANGDIQIWSVEKWYLRVTIPGHKQHVSRALAWIQTENERNGQQSERVFEGRLFSCELTGAIVEWDLIRLIPKYQKIITGGGIWSMDCIYKLIKNQEESEEGRFVPIIATACEDGRIRIFEVHEDGNWPLLSSSAKQGGRVLSVSLHENGEVVATGGSDGTVRTYDVDTGKQKFYMTVQNNSKTRPLNWSGINGNKRDYTIVSVNSLGETEFWDGEVGVRSQCLKNNNSSVTCVVRSKIDKDVIYTAGTDTKLSKFIKNNSGKWNFQVGRKRHTHDISAIAVINRGEEEMIITGGIDTKLIVHDISKDLGHIVLPFSQNFQFAANRSKKLVFHQSLQLKIWNLGSVVEDALENIDNYENFDKLNLKRKQQLLLDLNFNNGPNLICSAISPDGQYFSASNSKQIRVFKILQNDPQNDSNISLKKIQFVKKYSAVKMIFSCDSEKLIIATNDMKIRVLSIAERKQIAKFEHHKPGEFSGLKEEEGAPILNLVVSDDGQWLASADAKNRIHIYNLDTFLYHCSLPIFESQFSCLTFNPSGSLLLVVCVDNSLYTFDVENKDLSQWSKSITIPKSFLQRKEIFTSASFNPANPSLLILQATSYFYIINLSPKSDKASKRNREGEDLKKHKPISNFHPIFQYHSMVFSQFIDSNELIIVQRPWELVASSFPTPVYQKKYRKN